EGDVEPEIEACVGEGRSAGEAMQHAAEPATAVIAKNADGVLVGFARVDDDGQIQFARELDLSAEDRLLHVARREVVVIIEADLADRARERRLRDLPADD